MDKNISFSELTSVKQDLVLEALKALNQSYSPYSNFKVGASLLTKKGEIFSAANMENASYGLSVCAEVGALQKAFNAGQKEILTIAVVGGNNKNEKEIVTPCGRCRQLIYESSSLYSHDIELLLCSLDLSKIVQSGIYELLPLPFGPKNLEIN